MAKRLGPIRGVRGQALTISLGKVYDGTLRAWMSKDGVSYRSFDIDPSKDGITMSQDKMKDYVDGSGNVIESVLSSWEYDVKFYPTSGTIVDEKVIYKGTIFIEPDTTGKSQIEAPKEIY